MVFRTLFVFKFFNRTVKFNKLKVVILVLVKTLISREGFIEVLSFFLFPTLVKFYRNFYRNPKFLFNFAYRGWVLLTRMV